MFSDDIILGKGEFNMFKKLAAEFVATMILVLIGCGVAIGVGCADNAGIVATAAAFGVSIIVLAYTVGQVSGGHANPAVSLAMAIRGDITWKEFALYALAQVLGAFAGSGILALIFLGIARGTGANSNATLISFVTAAGLEGNAANLAGMGLAVLVEIVLTFLFILLILGVTSKKEWGGLAGLLIGIALFGIHLVGIPLTGTSVNPARGLSALIVSMFDGKNIGDKALVLIPAVIAPFIGAALAALFWKAIAGKKEAKEAE